MGRYDRIARITPPARDDAFDGWLSLRDLEGREREPELGRRALLRFLALRPIRRLLMRGIEGPDPESLRQQLDGVRSRLDRLASTDAERQRIADYLEEVGGRSPEGVIRATLDVGASAEAAGHPHAAEEFYRTAIELAEANGLDRPRLAGLRHLARVLRDRRAWDEARTLLESAAAEADRLGAADEWARCVESLSAVALRQGQPDEARSLLARIEARGRAGTDDAVRAMAAAGLCALELAEGRAELAVEAGWQAVRLLGPEDEIRNRVLLNMAAAFRRLGLGPAAASCYDIVTRWAPWPEHRIEARLEHAIVAAESGDADAFARRRAAVLDRLDAADRPLRAMVHLGLGRGAFLVGSVDGARDHLREAITTARDVGADAVLERAEALLDRLEQRRSAEPAPRRTPTPDAREIAGRIEGMASSGAT